MDLPIFQDNLRSSSGWLAELEREKAAWNPELYSNVREAIAEEHRKACDLVSEWTRTLPADFSIERLIAINAALSGKAAVLRSTDVLPLAEGHDPVPAIILPRIHENALDWFRTDSFNEIHPVEQAALVLLRLCDLQPFPSHNLECAIISASFYTMRGNLPPVIIQDNDEMRPRFDSALHAAFRMLTQPLVETIGENLTRTIRMANR